MNGTTPAELKEEIGNFCNEIMEKLAESDAACYGDVLSLWREMHSFYLETMSANLVLLEKKYDNLNGRAYADKVEADTVVVEVLDKNTGKLYRRILPIRFCETSNGLLLSGEAMDGSPAQFVFYSEAAIAKISDLFGKGIDAPRCHEVEDCS
ncbi:MAG: hypothetical protein H6Q75_924 [Firmicutes bacterium]|nr:hypothetical protein [Bacillota bacterium]